MTTDPNAGAPADSGIFGLDIPLDDARVVLVPVPFEATVSYGSGAARGPAAILAASHQVDLYDIETGHPYRAGIHMLPVPEAIARLSESAQREAKTVVLAAGRGSSVEARGSLERVNAAGEEVNRWLHDTVRPLLEKQKTVGIIGGDHSVPFGALKAYAESFPSFGILHLDAHADLRRAYQGFLWSHASIMNNVITAIPEVSRLVQLGIRDLCPEERAIIDGSAGRVVTYYDPLLARARARGGLLELFEQAVSHLPAKVYVSIDIDGLDPKLCPHTGTPVPGGIDFNEVSMLLEATAESGRTIIGFDLVEVAPGPDGDEWDANVGARLLYKMIGWALKSQGI